jgi:Dihaem cytochrome c
MRRWRRWAVWVGIVLLGLPGVAVADEGFFQMVFGHHNEVEPVHDATFDEECGACHLAYQPGLLPRRSWERIMAPDALSDHFGDDASLEEPAREKIAAFLEEHAADDSPYKRSIKVRRSIPQDEAPLRITDVPYIRRKHADLGRERVQDNPKVKSLANCEACHRKAAEGVYDDDTVSIPGFGRDW